MKDLTLIIENVRTFRGRHEIPIRPLTILTGENSSGKTTLLAMFSAVCDHESYPLQPDFNKAPYNLGNFETIASNEPASGQADHFSVGFRRPDTDHQSIRDADARYVSERGRIQLSTFRARGGDFEFSIEVKGSTVDRLNGLATIRVKERTFKERFSNLQAPLSGIVVNAAERVRNTRVDDPEFSLVLLNLSLQLLHLGPAQVRSLAPTRTQPQRVYSQAMEAHKPTGEHIPFVLEQLITERAAALQKISLSTALESFGEESGLFQDVIVSRFGSKSSSPFELRVVLSGKPVNLIDVGYGVSQALPLLVEALTASLSQYLLVQEPEIHLHPRAQAALGTLFTQLAAQKHCRFVVETHSDYLIDRVRQEVAAGKIAPSMVGLMYLHREGLETKCHLIELDELGNLINPPDDYRSFFLEEEWRLLRRGARG
jgi:energy-coupling factor transporter ATP-binding protein EcfA2